ncbi:Uncharacterised protein [uncultured Blautia sp.]|nr:Uncharacterised protein [uncultured Blautia sp.]
MDHRQVRELPQHKGDGVDHQEGGQHHAQRGAEGAEGAAYLISYEGGGVDGNGARCGLGNGDNVQNVPVLQPAAAFRHLTLDQGDHGVASAKGEGADFGKSPEQLTGFGQICGHGNRSFRALGFLPQRTLFRDIHQSI